MKKWIGLGLLAVLALSSCVGPKGEDGLDGLDGKDGYEPYWGVSTFEIKDNMWHLEGLPNAAGSYYECAFDVEDLTEELIKAGMVSVLHESTDDKRVIHLTPLPYTIYRDDNGVLFSEHYSYELSPGHISFFLDYSDFHTSTAPPSIIKFRLIMTY